MDVAKVTKIPGTDEKSPRQVCFFRDDDDRIGMSWDEGMTYIKSLANRAHRSLARTGKENYLHAQESAKKVFAIAKKAGINTLAKTPMNIDGVLLKVRADAGFTGIDAETPPQDDELNFDDIGEPSEDSESPK